MIISTKKGTPKEELEKIVDRFEKQGLDVTLITGKDYNGLLDYLDVCCQQMGIEPDFFQSNHEGDIIDEIQSAAGRADGIILNPGGYAYYSVAILEALQLCGVPAVEVLMSEPSGREPFRNTDVVSFGCQGRFAGEGIGGYLHACSYLVQLLRLDGGAQSHMVQ